MSALRSNGAFFAVIGASSAGLGTLLTAAKTPEGWRVIHLLLSKEQFKTRGVDWTAENALDR